MKYIHLRFPHFRLKALTLSYDDGTVHDKRLIEIMSKNGLKGTFNINSGLLSLLYDGKKKLTPKEAYELYTSTGNEVAVHGEKHLHLTAVDAAIASNEILQDRLSLEKMFGNIITGMAYAYGAYNDSVVDIIKNCGIEYARTAITTERFSIPDDWHRLPTTCHHNNPRLMELAKRFVEDKPFNKKCYWDSKPKLFYLWGHSYEFNNNNNWNIIEEFAEYVGNRDDVWYATNIEVYKYVKAFESLRYSADGNFVNNPGSIDIYLNYCGEDVFVPAGKTVSTAPVCNS